MVRCCKPRLVMADRGKQVARGQTASAAYQNRRTRTGPPRPALQDVWQFVLLAREVEIQFRPRMLEVLQNVGSLAKQVDTVANSLQGQTPACSRCSQPLKRHNTETVSRVARFDAYTPR